VLKFWREEIGVKEIWAGAFPGNVRSRRVAEKLGFMEGGKFRVLMPGGEEKEVVGWCWRR
jgi:RimJ/RimL family protein N-acetyltransferase